MKRKNPSRGTVLVERPDLAAEWHKTLNKNLKPADLTLGSDRKVWWQCNQGPDHVWASSVANRVAGNGCPVCAGRKVVPSTCLATTHPDIAAQWHPSLNGSVTPNDVGKGSHKCVYWRCLRQHVWSAKVETRTRLARTCPYCTGRYTPPEKSLATLNPFLASEWHPTKNGQFTPSMVSLGSDRKPWWLCARGHSWQATVSNRHHHRSNCPKCTRQTSRPELRLYSELRTIFPDVKHRAKINPRLECDVVIPSINLAIQYDGKRYHQGKLMKDVKNSESLTLRGFQVIRIRDTSLPTLPWAIAINEKQGLLISDIKSLLSKVPRQELTHDQRSLIRRYMQAERFLAETDYLDLCSMIPGAVPGSSLADLHADIAKMWHPEKNGRLTPSMVTPGSTTKVYWKCKRHGSYLGTVADRVKGRRCPHCTRRVVLPEDSIEVLFPDLAQQFHPTRNGAVKASSIAPGSRKKYWWKCQKNPDHEWSAVVQSRVDGCGCPICSNKKIVFSNSLAATNPALAEQWNHEKNNGLTPSDVAPFSSKKVWWRCESNPEHTWEAPIKNRSRLGSGCPYCDGKRTDRCHSLAVLRPDLALEWHPSLNGELTPSDVLPGSGRKVWWQCIKDPRHVWMARIESRNSGHKNCCDCGSNK